MNTDSILQALTHERTLASLIVVVVISVVVRFLIQRRVASLEGMNETARLRLRSQLRLIPLALLLLGLIFVWGQTLRDFLVSVLVLASAIVVATKELIMCFTGGTLRATSQAFRVGDRVEIGAVRGDVIQTGLLTTTLLETGPSHQRTGRLLVIPELDAAEHPPSRTRPSPRTTCCIRWTCRWRMVTSGARRPKRWSGSRTRSARSSSGRPSVNSASSGRSTACRNSTPARGSLCGSRTPNHTCSCASPRRRAKGAASSRTSSGRSSPEATTATESRA